MYILGIAAFYHDSSAVLIKDGEIIAAVQEERFTRKKADSSFPVYSINYCLEEAGIEISDVEYVIFYDKPILKFDRIISSYIHTAPKGLLSFLKAVPIWLRKKLWIEDLIKKELKYKKDVYFTTHHQSHAASAFFPSPFNKAAILTIDGAGEWDTTVIGVGEGNNIKLLKKIKFPNSIGLLYSAFTYYCGFRVNSGEYKLMGLAPYGEPEYVDLIKKEIITINDDGSFILNQKYFNYISGLKMISKKFEKLFGKRALKSDEKPTQFYMDVAASIQKVTEEVILKLAKEAKKITGANKLVLAGGVALNCVANGKMLKEKIFDDVWIQPASGDAGGALGAAMYVYYSYLDNKRYSDELTDKQKGSYLGPSYSSENIKSMLDSYGASYNVLDYDKLINEVADNIKNQKVIGWFQGRMEFGPRALGNRSILGDPRSEDMQKVMNLKIKFRESFRPFAPSVLEEKSTDYFELNSKSPYMLLTTQVKKDKLVEVTENKKGFELLSVKRSVVQAITHVDNSARVQSVSASTNKKYYDLISKFYEKTDCPLVINTSFNVRGEPIVCTPEDAFFCFMGTNIDVLVLDNYILYKDKQTKDTDLTRWKRKIIKD